MKEIKETSFGIIPIRKIGNEWQVLLIKHQAGHWAFPKGHPEGGETAKETALRELYEETNLKVIEFLDPAPLEENYVFKKDSVIVKKTVKYFLATVSGNIILQEEELSAFEWVNLTGAKIKITFPEGKELCSDVEKRLAT